MIKRNVKMLRFWNRISQTKEAEALSHGAFRWLYGLVLGWSGVNNGCLEFTRRRHGKKFGLNHPGTFARARDEVISSGLVLVSARGGDGAPATFAIALLPIQVAPGRNGTETVPSKSVFNGTEMEPSGPKSGTEMVPTRYRNGTVEKSSHIKIARAHTRASEYGKEKHTSSLGEATTSANAVAPDPNAVQRGCEEHTADDTPLVAYLTGAQARQRGVH